MVRSLPILVWLLILLSPIAVDAQKAERIARLKAELSNASTDTAQIRLLLTLAMTYEGYDTDSALAYGYRTLDKATASENKKGRADAILHIGRLKRGLSQDVEALNHMFDALKLYRELRDSVQIANSLNDISIIYANSGDFKNSLNYFEQALEIFRRTGDEKGQSYALNNIGIIHQELNDLETATKYFLESLEIKIRNNDLYGISRGYTNLGSIAETNEDWEKAMDYYKKADSIYVLTNDKQVQGTNDLAMARVRQAQGEIGEARRLALKGFRTAKEINDLSTMLACSKFVAELDEEAKNYRSALTYQKIYNELSDSLNNESHQATLEELKAKFNLEEKERQIALLQKDKELHEAREKNSKIITYALAAGMVLLLLILGLIYYAYRTTKSARDSLARKNSEIQKQKDDLDKLNREKDRFFSILSHDLRSPLHSLKGLSNLLVRHDEKFTPEELRDVMKRMDASLDGMTELINNILEWSITSSKKRTWLFDKVDVSSIIHKNVSTYQNIAESKGIHLACSSPDDLFGYADKQAIDTVIRNLLSNSIKFSHANGQVIVTAAQDGDSVRIAVKDHGVGMSPEIHNKLFTVNCSVSQIGTQKEKGRGLGLLLCMELMKENNGTIWAESEPGVGSQFFISFPAYKPN